MDNFITWDILLNYTTFVSVVFMVVEFTKTMPIIKKISTKYWSAIVSFALLTITNVVMNTFQYQDLLLYILSAISISLGANGLSTFNKKEK